MKTLNLENGKVRITGEIKIEIYSKKIVAAFMKHFFIIFVFLCSVARKSHAQTPLEVFVGDKRTTIDVFFIRFFKKHDTTNSRFLVFNRDRASIDYRQTSSAYLPQFSFTKALSYNIPGLKGLAPTVVVQVFNSGVFPKVGFNYLKRKNYFTFFSWLVIDAKEQPNIDWFLLTRFEPKLTEKINFYSQFELVNNFATEENKNHNLTQRFRLGIKLLSFQFGVAADFNEIGNSNYANPSNIGAFLRYEF